jgi:hypothetical protein
LDFSVLTSRETAPEAVERPIKLRENKARKVSAKEVKKDKPATKTLKNSNKQFLASAHPGAGQKSAGSPHCDFGRWH